MTNDTDTDTCTLHLPFRWHFDKTGNDMVLLHSGDRKLLTINYNRHTGHLSLNVDKNNGHMTRMGDYDTFQAFDFEFGEDFTGIFDDTEDK